jgi:glycolate oxidase FAD binding subunit
MSKPSSCIAETISPADAVGIAEAVRLAAGQGRAVYPIGGGTHAAMGAATKRPGIGVSLANLNRVLDYPADDMTITVEAGLTIAELSRHLAEHGQRLPVDVPNPEQATVGGAVAVNASGPRRYAYGTLRDYVLGFTAVDGNGEIFSGGGRVVKNAAGYNMTRLITGALGTLGVLTQVTLMVRPIPEASAVLTCGLPRFGEVERHLDALVRSASRPVAVEWIVGNRLPAGSLGGLPEDPSASRLVVGFEGPADEVDWMAAQLQQEWNAAGLSVQPSKAVSYSDRLWQEIASLPADVEINVLPGAVAATVEKALQIVPNSAACSHAGNGVILVRLNNSHAEKSNGEALYGAGKGDEVVLSWVQSLRETAAAAGGNLIVLQRPAEADWTISDVWGPAGPAANVMQSIKDRFDPQNILNPGRFVFA